MKLITRDTDYAVRALCFIARDKDKKTSVTELVRKLRIPRPFLRKILQLLNKEGLLISRKGQGGGFSLALPVEKISLADLVRIFQGPFSLNECTFKRKVCPRIKSCPLRKKLDDIERYIVSELSMITIACLLEED